MFTCVNIKGGKRAAFRKIWQCMAYNIMNDDSIYDEMHLRGSTTLKIIYRHEPGIERPLESWPYLLFCTFPVSNLNNQFTLIGH